MILFVALSQIVVLYSMHYSFAGNSLFFKDITCEHKATLKVAWDKTSGDLELFDDSLCVHPTEKETYALRLNQTTGVINTFVQQVGISDNKICTFTSGDQQYKDTDFNGYAKKDAAIKLCAITKIQDHDSQENYVARMAQLQSSSSSYWYFSTPQDDIDFVLNDTVYQLAINKIRKNDIFKIIASASHNVSPHGILHHITINPHKTDALELDLPTFIYSKKTQWLSYDTTIFLSETIGCLFTIPFIGKKLGWFNIPLKFDDFAVGPSGQLIARSQDNKLFYATTGRTYLSTDKKVVCFKPNHTFKQLLQLPEIKDQEMIKLWFTDDHIGIYQGKNDYTDGVLNIYKLIPQIYELKMSCVKSQEDREMCIQKSLRHWKH